MAFMEWTEEMDVGISEFNNHHKKLIELINRLFNAMSENKTKEVLEQIFLELIDYTKYHFSAEEKLMIQLNYPEYELHKQEHEILTKQVMEKFEDYKHGRVLVGLHLFTFLKNWLYDHIMKEDKKYGEFFRSKGIY
jgi:hemerythrin